MKSLKSSVVSEAIVALASIGALLLLINPFSLIMTSAFTLTIIMVLAVALIAFGIFVWQHALANRGISVYCFCCQAPASGPRVLILVDCSRGQRSEWTIIVTFEVAQMDKVVAFDFV